MSPLPNKRPKFTFKILGASFETGVLEVAVDEMVSTPFEAHLHLVCEDSISLGDVIGKEGLLTISSDTGDPRYLHGIINRFAQTGKQGRFLLYRALLVPQMWVLSQKQNSRIFQNQSVKDIVSDMLKEAQLPGDRYAFRLQGDYKAKEYCVQYHETDLGFISRLLEEEGIWYFFEHSREKHVLVFADAKSAYKPIEGETTLVYKHSGGMVPKEESVFEFSDEQNMGPGKLSQTDYNYNHPSQPLATQDETKEFKNLEIYEHPGRYEDDETGRRLAKIRLEEATALREIGRGKSTCARLSAGRTFKLKGHENGSFDKEYLVISVLHDGKQPQVLEEANAGGAMSYANELTVIPSSVVLRPARKTHRPVVYGPQSATVVGPEGEEIYTDELGRVKVKFHWDRAAAKDEKSSCWIRVSQLWAGEGWGAMFVPRKGQEVIVSFIDGDPDRPIITGRVYNGATPLPHALPQNKTKSTIMSQSTSGGGGANELSFEDAKGQEEVFLHAQKNLIAKIEHDKSGIIGNDETLTVGQNRTEQVGNNQATTIGGVKIETVVKASTENVGLAKLTNVGADYSVNVGAAHTITVGGLMNTAVGLAQVEEVGLSKNTIVGQDLSTTVKKDHVLNVSGSSDTIIGKSGTVHVTDSFEIVCGQSSFRLEQDGTVTLTGKEFKIAASGSVKINGQAVDIN